MIFSVVILFYNVRTTCPSASTPCWRRILKTTRSSSSTTAHRGFGERAARFLRPLCCGASPERIRCAIHKPNGGVGEARNVGIEAAQGEYPDSSTVTTIASRLRSAFLRRCRLASSDIMGGARRWKLTASWSRSLRIPLQADRLHSFTPFADTPELMQTMPPLEPHPAAQPVSGFRVRYPARIWYEDRARP